ncbi:MarR family winged helix-turn-helix transcriptional regulator [Leptolyngbya sp. PL-A3]
MLEFMGDNHEKWFKGEAFVFQEPGQPDQVLFHYPEWHDFRDVGEYVFGLEITRSENISLHRAIRKLEKEGLIEPRYALDTPSSFWGKGSSPPGFRYKKIRLTPEGVVVAQRYRSQVNEIH